MAQSLLNPKSSMIWTGIGQLRAATTSLLRRKRCGFACDLVSYYLERGRNLRPRDGCDAQVQHLSRPSRLRALMTVPLLREPAVR
jgi:hypothetical protein